jgi:hypothetical protein
MRKNSTVWLFFLAIAVVSGLVLFCSVKPEEVVISYQEAYNAGDMEKLLSLQADDVRFEMVGDFTLLGKEQIGHLAEYDFTLNTQMSMSQLETRGDTVRCELVKTSDWLKTADILEARYYGTFIVTDGLIQSIRAEQAPQTRAALKRLQTFLMDWGKQERPEQLAEMMPQGKLLFNAENAERSLAFLMEWKQNVHRQAIRPGWKKLGE